MQLAFSTIFSGLSTKDIHLQASTSKAGCDVPRHESFNQSETWLGVARHVDRRITSCGAHFKQMFVAAQPTRRCPAEPHNPPPPLPPSSGPDFPKGGPHASPHDLSFIYLFLKRAFTCMKTVNCESRWSPPKRQKMKFRWETETETDT